jgi:hypothetical protein
VVYDIRGHPNLQQHPEDIFAVFHFHTRQVVTDGGLQYPEITEMLVYHGQTVFQNNGTGGGFGNPANPAT